MTRTSQSIRRRSSTRSTPAGGGGDGTHFTVRWAGADDADGSGLAGFTVYVSDDGGPFVPWLADTALTEATFAGQAGHRYAFYSAARDNAGNVEAAPESPDAARSVTRAAPFVTGVWVDGSAWSDAFRRYLEAQGAGSATDGYAVPAGAAQLLTLPWVNLNVVRVRFSEAVTIRREDLTLAGVNLATYAFTAFGYDPQTFTATWTLANPLATDRLLATLGSSVVDADGHPIDGEWVNGGAAAAFPSGDGVAGGEFRFALNVLPADADRSGSVDVAGVNAGDLVKVRNRGGTSTTNPGLAPNNYSIFHDVNGSGVIDASDLVLTRNRGGTGLPAAGLAPAGAAASLFSSTRLGEDEPDELARLLA